MSCYEETQCTSASFCYCNLFGENAVIESPGTRCRNVKLELSKRHCLTHPITASLGISLYIHFLVNNNQMFSIFSSQIKFWLIIYFIQWKNEVCDQDWCSDKVCSPNCERSILQAYILAPELHQWKNNSSGTQHKHYVTISKCPCFMTEFMVLLQLTARHSRFIYWLVPKFYRRHLFFYLHVQKQIMTFHSVQRNCFFFFNFLFAILLVACKFLSK